MTTTCTLITIRGLPRYQEDAANGTLRMLPPGPDMKAWKLEWTDPKDGRRCWHTMEDLHAAKRFAVNQGIVPNERAIDVIRGT